MSVETQTDIVTARLNRPLGVILRRRKNLNKTRRTLITAPPPSNFLILAFIGIPILPEVLIKGGGVSLSLTHVQTNGRTDYLVNYIK